MGPTPGNGVPDLAHSGLASADLFASGENTKCPLWCSVRHESVMSLGMDAFGHSPWPLGLLYAFPPVTLVLPLVQRVRAERRAGIMVVPGRPGPAGSHYWYAWPCAARGWCHCAWMLCLRRGASSIDHPRSGGIV